jgi:hypothetical protein
MIFAFPFSIALSGLTNRMIQQTSALDVPARRGFALRRTVWLVVGGTGMGLLLLAVAPIVAMYAADRGVSIPLTAVVFLIANSVLLLGCLPLFALAVADHRIIGLATVRTVAGVLLLALVSFTALGTSATGAAAATAASSLFLALGIAAIEYRRTR